MALLLPIPLPNTAVANYHRATGLSYIDFAVKRAEVRVYSYLTEAAREVEKNGEANGTKASERPYDVSFAFFNDDGTPKALSGTLHEILYAALKALPEFAEAVDA